MAKLIEDKIYEVHGVKICIGFDDVVRDLRKEIPATALNMEMDQAFKHVRYAACPVCLSFFPIFNLSDGRTEVTRRCPHCGLCWRSHFGSQMEVSDMLSLMRSIKKEKKPFHPTPLGNFRPRPKKEGQRPMDPFGIRSRREPHPRESLLHAFETWANVTIPRADGAANKMKKYIEVNGLTANKGDQRLSIYRCSHCSSYSVFNSSTYRFSEHPNEKLEHICPFCFKECFITEEEAAAALQIHEYIRNNRAKVSNGFYMSIMHEMEEEILDPCFTDFSCLMTCQVGEENVIQIELDSIPQPNCGLILRRLEWMTGS